MAIPYQMPIFGVSPSGQPVQTRYYPQFMHPLPTNRPPVASVRQYPSPAVQDRWNGDAQLPKGYGRILGRMSGPSENEWKNSSEKALTKGFGSLRANGNFADFLIVCGEKEFDVHAVVISVGNLAPSIFPFAALTVSGQARSRYFFKACTGNFKESDERCIELKGDKPEVIEALIDYLYGLDFEIPTRRVVSQSADVDNGLVDFSSTDGAHGSESEYEPTGSTKRSHSTMSNDPPHIFLLAEMYVAADKYEVSGLGELVCDKLAKALANVVYDIDSAVTLKLIDFVCSSTHENAPIRRVLHNHLLCCDLYALMNTEESKAVLMSHPNLLFGTLKMLAAEVRPESASCCTEQIAKSIVKQKCTKSVKDTSPDLGRGPNPHEGRSVVVRSFYPGAKTEDVQGEHVLQ